MRVQRYNNEDNLRDEERRSADLKTSLSVEEDMEEEGVGMDDEDNSKNHDETNGKCHNNEEKRKEENFQRSLRTMSISSDESKSESEMNESQELPDDDNSNNCQRNFIFLRMYRHKKVKDITNRDISAFNIKHSWLWIMSLQDMLLYQKIESIVHEFFLEMKTYRIWKATDQLYNYLKFTQEIFTNNLQVYPAHTLGEYLQDIASNPSMPQNERMKYDMIRTSTFSNFPRNSPVSVLSLVKAGFYFEEQSDEVMCFKCGVKYSNWQIRDDPLVIHRRISPACSFIAEIGLSTDREVPNSMPNNNPDNIQNSLLYSRQNPGRDGDGISHSHMQSESFSNSPESRFGDQSTNNASSRSLQLTSAEDTRGVENERHHVYSVANGLFQNHGISTSGDEGFSSSAISNVSNVYHNSGQGISSHLSSHNLPTAESIANDFSQNVSISTYEARRNSTSTTSNDSNEPQNSGQGTSSHFNSPNMSNTTDSQQAAGAADSPKSAAATLEPLGISIEKPKYPQYAVLTTRIASFKNWPSNLEQRPDELARAGFLYEGRNDFTRCFFCAGGLRDWEAGDIPWIEHARWYQKCVFLRQCMGDDFVNLVKEGKIEDAKRKLNGQTSKTKINTTSSPSDVKSEEITRQSNVNETSSSDEHPREVLLEENRHLREQQICKICMDEDVAVVFLPCGHMVTCVNCAPAIRKCPLCRQFIKGTIKAILS